MATVAHVIYSRYDPKQREALERATGQLDQDMEGAEGTDPWQAESASTFHRRPVPPPYFVPATLSEDSRGRHADVPPPVAEPVATSTSLSRWYKSLTSTSESNSGNPQSVSQTSSAPDSSSPISPYTPTEKPTKNNWFIMHALPTAPPVPTSTAPSLADILARDPPKKHTPHTPRVWLAIGPSNKGFEMLQASGWNEGEALGPNVIRRKPFDETVLGSHANTKQAMKVNQEERQVQWGDDKDVCEIQKVDVIDLTRSDSESDETDDHDDSSSAYVQPGASEGIASSDSSSSILESSDFGQQKALLTPIPVALKSDRLGIGLKAKTNGPYHASQRKVTHGAASVAAHVRAAEDARRLKKQIGKGRRGFAKVNKREETSRKALLAYLNE